jgi:hypothetical protein
MAQLPRHPCPVCGRRIAATTTSLYVTRREGTWIRYVYLRTHNNPEGQRAGRGPVSLLRPAIPPPGHLARPRAAHSGPRAAIGTQSDPSLW